MTSHQSRAAASKGFFFFSPWILLGDWAVLIFSALITSAFRSVCESALRNPKGTWRFLTGAVLLCPQDAGRFLPRVRQHPVTA